MSHKGANKAMKEINKRHHTQHTTGRNSPNRNRRAYPGKHTGDNSPTDKPDTGNSRGKTPRNSVINDRNF